MLNGPDVFLRSGLGPLLILLWHVILLIFCWLPEKEVTTGCRTRWFGICIAIGWFIQAVVLCIIFLH